MRLENKGARMYDDVSVWQQMIGNQRLSTGVKWMRKDERIGGNGLQESQCLQ